METVTVAEEELTTMKYVNATTEFTVEEINSFFFYEVSIGGDQNRLFHYVLI